LELAAYFSHHISRLLQLKSANVFRGFGTFLAYLAFRAARGNPMTMNGSIDAALVGRLGTEPELKTNQAGKPWEPEETRKHVVYVRSLLGGKR
jgi:hypothetical protein